MKIIDEEELVVEEQNKNQGCSYYLPYKVSLDNLITICLKLVNWNGLSKSVNVDEFYLKDLSSTTVKAE